MALEYILLPLLTTLAILLALSYITPCTELLSALIKLSSSKPLLALFL